MSNFSPKAEPNVPDWKRDPASPDSPSEASTMQVRPSVNDADLYFVRALAQEDGNEASSPGSWDLDPVGTNADNFVSYVDEGGNRTTNVADFTLISGVNDVYGLAWMGYFYKLDAGGSRDEPYNLSTAGIGLRSDPTADALAYGQALITSFGGFDLSHSAGGRHNMLWEVYYR